MKEETIPCETCGEPTIHTGTKRCNNCYEIESRMNTYLRHLNGRRHVFAKIVELELERLGDEPIPFFPTQAGQRFRLSCDPNTANIPKPLREGYTNTPKARCPKCGCTKLHVAVHTMYELEDGQFQGVVTDGPEENLTNCTYTICSQCDTDGPFHKFELES